MENLWLEHSLQGELLASRTGLQAGEKTHSWEAKQDGPNICQILYKLGLLGRHHPGRGRDALTGLLNPCPKNAKGQECLGISSGEFKCLQNEVMTGQM